MAKIYYGTVNSITSNTYTVEIHHKTNSPTPEQITLGSGGFYLEYEGQGNALYENNVMSSSCTINVQVDSQSLLDGVTAIAESKETDYFIVIYKGSDLFWAGMIINDQIIIPRGSYQGVVGITIKANDRLKVLNTIDFDFGTYSLGNNRERGLELIKQIIQKDNSYITGLYSGSDRYILDSIEVKSPNQPSGTLYNTSYRKESFMTNFDINGNFSEDDEYISCRDSVEQILKPFNAQLLYTDGYYVIRQFENQFTSSTEFNAYTKTLGSLSTYTISNGLNINENVRSAFEAVPDYTYQPAIREITTEINKKNIHYQDITTPGSVLATLNNTTPDDIGYKFAKINVNLRNILTGTTNAGTVYTANDIMIYADFWVKDSGGDYYYLNGGEMKLYGSTEPNYYERIAHVDVTQNPNDVIDIVSELRMPDIDCVEYDLEVVAKTNWYSNVPTKTYATKKTILIYKFTHDSDTVASSRIGLQFSYNSWNDDDTADYGFALEYANDIKTGNEPLSNNPVMGNIYYSGELNDIYGLLSWDNADSEWKSSAFDLDIFGLGVSSSAEKMPLIMAANIYENTVKTIEGNLLTNGAIYAINSIFIDSSRWHFNGGRFDAQNEAWNGQWVKVTKGTIKSGKDGTRFSSRGHGWANTGGFLDHYDKKIGHVVGSSGNVGERVIQRVVGDIVRTQDPSDSEIKALQLEFDSSDNSYKFGLGISFPSPFNITSDTSLVSFGEAGVVITLTGSYFHEDSEVSINKGTLNSKSVVNQGKMTLNIDAIASSDPTGNTCDVTIDGVVFTNLWTYAVNYTGTLADDYITARGITDDDHESYLQTLETALFTAGLINDDGTSNGKLDALWLFGGTQATAAGHKWNFIDAQNTDEAFRLTMYGGLTHNNNGITGNGTDGYIDSHFSASDFGGQNDGHVGIYIRNDLNPGASLKGAYGARHSSFKGTVFFPRYNSKVYSSLNSATGSGTSNTNTTGHWVTSRNAATDAKLYRNGSEFWDSGLSSHVDQPSASIKLLAVDYNEGQYIYQHSAYNIAGAHMGGKLTADEVSDLYDALDAYYTSLGINV